MVCISWSLSLSLQNTLIGVSFMEHTVHPFERNNSVNFRTTIVVDLTTFSSPSKGNPVPSAVSSDTPFRPAPCGHNQARSHSFLGRFGPSRTAYDWHSVLCSLIFAPSSFRRRQRNPRCYDKRRSESDVALFYHLPQSSTYQLKRGELQKSALPSALEVIEAAVRPGERTQSPGRDAHCLQCSGF